LTENVEVTNGNSGDNTFNAYTKFVAAVGQMNTLQSGDVVNGGEGNDTLIAESTGGTIAATLNSVENLRLTSYGATTIEGANATGLKSVSIENSVNTSTVRNLSEVVELTVKNQTGNNDVTIGYTDTALTGTNVQKLTLNNVTMKAAGGRILFDDNNGAGTLEQLDIAVTGASDIAGIRDIAGTNVLDGVATVNVNATAKADLGVIGAAKMTTFDASASTAGVTADVSAATGNDLAIKGGEGDDVITFGATANLTAKDSVDLGAGANTLRITGTANGTSYNVKNVQTLEVTTDGNNQVNAEAFGAGVSTIGFVSANNGHAGQVNNLADGATVAAKDATGAVNTLNVLTINGKNTSGSTDSVTVKLFSNDEGTASTPSVFTVATLTAGGYENVKLVSEGKANTANAVTTLTATAQKTVTIEGDKKLTVGNTLSATTVDATASTGGVDLTLAGTAVSGGKQTATGGTANDTFRIDADVLTKDIKIDGGEGVDTLVLTKVAPGNIDLTGVTNAELISGVSNFENLSFGGQTLLIDDATLNRFTDKTINVVEKGGAATVLNASAVLGSTSKLNVDASEMTAGGSFTFAISNGIDGFKGSSQADTITVGASAFLTDADVLNGGAGNNNVFDFDTTGAAKQIVTASQLTNVSNFNTWNIKDTAAPAVANEFELTVTNAVAAQNINSTNNTLTISAATNASDKVTIDASDVGSAYKLIVSTGTGTGAAAAQTVKLGAGDDTITLNSAAAGATVNTVTLGGGKDTVKFTANSAKAAAAVATDGLLSNNVIKDFNFGTATGTGANVDKLDLSAFGIVTATDAAGGIGKAGTTGDFQVVVLNDVSYDTQQAVDTAVKAIATGNAVGDNVVVFWQDSLGRVQVGYDLDATDATVGTYTTTGVVTLGVLEGVTITGVAANIDLGDLILV
ncbi:MAG: hypothetical protein PHE74_13395, partial [Comamonas sp.]|nr:hypothetical protein [Comamonas sp.]